MIRKYAALILAFAIFSFLGASVSNSDAASKKKDAKSDASASKSSKASAKDDAAAIVNGHKISKAALDAEASRYEKQFAQSGKTPDEAQKAELRKKVLTGLIEKELLLQESQQLGMKASDQEISDQLASFKKRFHSDAEYQEAIKSMNMTEAEIKTQIGDSLAIKKALDHQVSSKATVTPEETKAFYDAHPDLFKTQERVRASHILVKVDAKATPEEKAKGHEKILGIQKRLKSGEDFANVAKEVSDCPSAPRGGDLDYFQKGQMVGPFEDAAFALKPGEMSDIVETEFGYHIIKLTDKKPAGAMTYEEVKDKLEQHLKDEKAKQQISQHLDELKSKAKIEILEK